MEVLKTESDTQIILVDHRLLSSSSPQHSQKTFQTEILAWVCEYVGYV